MHVFPAADTSSMRLAALIALVAYLSAVTGCASQPDRESARIDRASARLIDALQSAYERGAWNEALQLADSAAARVPELAVVPYTRGLILTKLHRYAEAASAYRAALEIDPGYRKAWFSLGHNAFLQRDYRQALTFYEKERVLVSAGLHGSGSAPTQQDRRALPAIAAQIGRTYDLLGIADSAQAAYREAIGLDSTYAVAHFWLSEHLVKRGHLQEALAHARKALAANPGELEYLYQVGSLLFQTGRARESVPLLTTVVQRWPGHEGAAYNLGRALRAIGQEDEARTVLESVDDRQRLQEEALQAQRAVEMYPDDPDRWVTLAGLMLRSGYYEKADEALSAAAALRPENLSVRNDLANVALVRGDTTLALQRFRALLEEDSTFSGAWLNLGIIHAIRGEHDEARAAWRKVLRYNPEDPDAKAYLAGINGSS